MKYEILERKFNDQAEIYTEKWHIPGLLVHGRPHLKYCVKTEQGELLLETRSILEVTAFLAGWICHKRAIERAL